VHPIAVWRNSLARPDVRWLLVALLLILAVLQYRLWIAEGSLAEQRRLERQVEEQVGVNRALRERNAILEREVLELQSGNKSVEQRAREQLGLVREGETFYLFVEEKAAPAADKIDTRQ
jgi:cell division protein FtsB